MRKANAAVLFLFASVTSTPLRGIGRSVFPSPSLAVGGEALSGINIANQISRHFAASDAGNDSGSANLVPRKEANAEGEDESPGEVYTHPGFANKSVVEQMHSVVVGNEDVRSQWDQGIVPTFPFYHGQIFYEDKKMVEMEEGKREDSASLPSSRMEVVGGTSSTSEGGASVTTTQVKHKPSSSSDQSNVVRAGVPGATTHTSRVEECTTLNGQRVCKERPTRQCGGAFSVGGNCAGQDAPKEDLRVQQEQAIMGGDVRGAQQTNIVPFTQQQVGMNMLGPVVTTTRSTTSRPRTTTTRRPITRNELIGGGSTALETRAPANPSTFQELAVDRIMDMNQADLHDAIMDPMMMVMGTILTMAGAYMAMVIQELSVANAFAAAAVGKK